jgi:hypothetical protein
VNTFAEIAREEVAVRHLATSAQPPHATSPFHLWSSSLRAPHPFPSTVLLDTPGVLLKGLRCFPAACPLPATLEGHGNPPASPEIKVDTKEKSGLTVTPTLFREPEVLICKT